MIVEVLVSLFLLVGAAFALVGSIGLARLPDFYTRLHGPTKATTLGVGGMVMASFLHFTARGAAVSLHEILVILFLFMTAPVSAYLMAKAALHVRTRSLCEPPGTDKGPEQGELGVHRRDAEDAENS